MLKAIQIGERIVGFFSEPDSLVVEREGFENAKNLATDKKVPQVVQVGEATVAVIHHKHSGRDVVTSRNIDSAV